MRACDLREMIENLGDARIEVVVWNGEDWVPARINLGVLHCGDEGDTTRQVLAVDWAD